MVSVISLKWEAKIVVVNKEVVGNFESLEREEMKLLFQKMGV